MDEEQSVAGETGLAPPAGSPRSERAVAFEATLMSAAAGLVAGGLAGFGWGGVGGRIAMRILFLTSDDRVKGITSDDGFEIGRISGDTIFLLIALSIAGAVVGLVYGLARMLLRGPTWVVAIGMGLAVATAAGGAIVNADGVDFRVLDPLWLAVGLFVLIPGLWGATVVVLTERLLRSENLFAMSPPQVERRLFGAVGATAGWLALATLATLGVVELANDLSELT